MSRFRQRIYSQYVEASDGPSVPRSLAGFASRAPTMRHVVSAFFPADRSAAILDLGCGHGILVHFARESGYSNISGVDVSSQQVALAGELGIDGIREGDLIETLGSLSPSSVDAIVTFDVVEHFTKDELLDLVDAIHRVLKKNGRWIIHAPNGSSPFLGAVRYGDFTHEQAFTPSSLTQLLRASGFSRLEFAECAPRSHGIKSFLRVMLWPLVRLQYRLMLAVESGSFQQSAIFTQNFFTVAYK